jgi:ankyrin repeat protein
VPDVIGNWNPLTTPKKPMASSQDKIVRLYDQGRTKPNALGRHGRTPFLRACFLPKSTSGKLDLVKNLLECGADPKYRDQNGWSALHAAVRRSDLDLAAFLLQQEGIDVENVDNDGNTPLLYAVQRRQGTRFLDLLVRAGANVDCVNKKNATSLLEAAQKSDTHTVQYVRSVGAGFAVEPSEFGSRLHAACRKGLASVVKVLLAQDASAVNQVALGRYAGTPLMASLRPYQDDDVTLEKRLDVLTVLLDNGADINQTDGCATAIGLAVKCTGYSPDTRVLEKLVSAGARLVDRDSEGRTALHLAVTHGTKQALQFIVNLLGDAGSKHLVDTDVMGRTPFHLAALHGRKDMLQFMVARLGKEKARQQVTAKDEAGRNAVSWAATGRHTNIGARVGLQDETPDSLATVKYLLELLGDGYDPGAAARAINDADKDGFTACHWAAKCAKTFTISPNPGPLLIELLIERGGDLSARAVVKKNMNGEYTHNVVPADIARYAGGFPIFEAFVKWRTDVHVAHAFEGSCPLPDDLGGEGLMADLPVTGDASLRYDDGRDCCYYCEAPCDGLKYECSACPQPGSADATFLCWKCISINDVIHPADQSTREPNYLGRHDFYLIGDEYALDHESDSASDDS